VKDPRGYASAYMGSVRKLKQYFDDIYGGVDKYLELYSK